MDNFYTWKNVRKSKYCIVKKPQYCPARIAVEDDDIQTVVTRWWDELTCDRPVLFNDNGDCILTTDEEFIDFFNKNRDRYYEFLYEWKISDDDVCDTDAEWEKII